MADSTYYITTKFVVVDNATGAIHGIESSTKGLGRTMTQAVAIGNLLGDAIGRAFNGAARAVKNLAKEMVGLNKEFEDQRLALTALINANLKFSDAQGKVSPARNLGISLGLAESQLESFVQAAKTAPGSARDFSNIAQFSIDPFLKSGGKLGQEFTDFITKTLIAGQFTGQAQEVTALDAQQLLQGLAKSRDRLPKLLGLDPESINKLAPTERLKKINDALEKVVTPETLGLLEDSFTTVKATFEDMIDIIKRTAGGPFFERVKNTLKDFNDFLEKNEKVISLALRTTIDTISGGFGAFFAVLKAVFFPITGLIELLSQNTGAAEAARKTISKNLQKLNQALDTFAQAIASVDTQGLTLIGQMVVIAVNSVLFAMNSLVNGLSIVAASIKSIALSVSSPFSFFSGVLSGEGVVESGKRVIQGIQEPLNKAFKGIQNQTLPRTGIYEKLRNSVKPEVLGNTLPSIPGGGGGGGSGGRATPKVNNNFYGDININQDFKANADPDRVAVSVKKVLEKLKARPTDAETRFLLNPRLV